MFLPASPFYDQGGKRKEGKGEGILGRDPFERETPARAFLYGGSLYFPEYVSLEEETASPFLIDKALRRCFRILTAEMPAGNRSFRGLFKINC